eukprot:CAMPEP_0181170052 /NCGR_PEP_ID=MMETSP1096-20121128/1151_1 /TAXON_ID=156174 ORGANISM="Chrysochromulina ericina, Strain CCMP281" /NCGR_SAMPLE_ID=MMETSP1096 /ASSEMBLY_ACC=CAM_ASM_000453 /LENGTH=222 /DNA_ID=CAMNT_0023257569 /DNA_START=788 /DNA_END=1455 /DNA_ORIENTATION=+
MKFGFSSHSPALTHPAHDSCRSPQTVVQRPHDLEHSRAMKFGLSMHWPAAAHSLHSVALEWESMHAPSAQISQVAGQFLYMKAELALALAKGSPARAALLEVLAFWCAHAAADGALAGRELGVLLTLAEVCPACALSHRVLALWGAEAAARRTVAQHKLCIIVALARLGPLHAGRVHIGARVIADLARKWAEEVHVLGVVNTMVFLGPVTALGFAVVADATA